MGTEGPVKTVRLTGMSKRATVILLTVGVAAIAFAAVAAVFASRPNPSPSSSDNMQINASLVTYSGTAAIAAPDLHLPRLGGGHPVTLTASGLGHQPLVINFFASWCTACQQELKAVASVAAEGRVAFVGVDTNETSTSTARRMLASVGANYPVGIGGTAQASQFRATGGLPTTIFVNRAGRVVAMALGAMTRSELQGWVTQLAAGKQLTQ